jgi:hypothetical protein
MEALAYVVPLIAFLATYEVLRRRAGDRAAPARVQWAWIAAGVAGAALAIVLGAVL